MNGNNMNKNSLLIIIALFLLLGQSLAKVPTQEQCRQEASAIVDQLIKTEVARDIDSQIKLFAPEVTQDGKSIKREQLRKENLSYYKRWPVAQWSLLKPVEVKQLTPDSFEVIYEASFRVESPERGKWSGGTLKSTLKIVKIDERYLIQGTEDHVLGNIKGELQRDPSDREFKTTSSKENLKHDPIVVYQSGLSREPTFAKNDSNGIYEIFGNQNEWCLVDKVSGVIIGKDIAKGNGYIDARFSPDSKKLLLFLSGHHGGPNFFELLDVDSFKTDDYLMPCPNIENRKDSKVFGEYKLSLSSKDDGNYRSVAKWEKGEHNLGVDVFQDGRRSALGITNYPINTTPSEQKIILLDSVKYLVSLKNKKTSVFNVDNISKVLSVDGDEFRVDGTTKSISIRNGSSIVCYSLITGNVLWKTEIETSPDTFDFHDQFVFIVENNQVSCLNVVTGYKVWIKKLDVDSNEKINQVKVSPNKKYIVLSSGGYFGHIYVLNCQSGDMLWKADSSGINAFSNDSTLLSYSVHAGFTDVIIKVIKTSEWKPSAEYSEEVNVPAYGFGDMVFSDNSKSIVFALTAFDKIRIANPKIGNSAASRFQDKSKYIINDPGYYKNIIYDEKSRLLAASDSEGFSNIWSLSSGHLTARILIDDFANPLSLTPEGYYLTLGSAHKWVGFRFDGRGYPLEQFDLRLNRPDIVLERLGAPKEAIETAKSLREKRLKRMAVTEEMLKPDFHLPELQIVGDAPATTSKDQLDLRIKATDDKYPLDRLRVYVNNVPVNGRDGEILRDQKTQSLEKTIPIKLAAGRNKIQVSVLNSAGAESLYANAEVNCTAERPKPKLYAVALGVSQYDRPEWCLKYATKDATDLIAKLKAKAGSSYSEVKPLLLTDKEVTKESVAKIKDFLSTATIDDTVLIFMAGHGLLDDKYDYYFGTTDIDPAKPSERGMPYEAIDTILAEVPSLKKALLMDTCHAGELDDDEKKDLAASDGSAMPAGIPAADTNSTSMAGKVAMRSIGTRGMSVKAVQGAKGKSDWYEKLQDMFVDLRRGSGATVISSSQGAEYAFESSEQSNGLFTYALMEALDGKATPNKDGQITISSVGEYVKKRVQDLTKGKQNPNLRGVNLEEDFTLSALK